MSKIKRDRKFDKHQADRAFYELGARIRGVKAVLVAALDMRTLEEAYDILALARDTLDQVVEAHDGQLELDWAHLMRRYEFGSTTEIMVDLLACASARSFDEAWKEKAIALCDRITREGYPDDRPIILRAWIDFLVAHGINVCRVNKDGERLPLLPETANENAPARHAGARG